MNPRRFVRVDRALLILSFAAAVWAVGVGLTGGFVLDAGALRLSSRSPWTAVAIALGSGLASLLLTPRDERRWDRVAPLAAAALSVAVVLLALSKGSFVASGSDIYGYVSQAHLWAAGQLHIDQPLLRELRWPNAEWAVAPLGYRPATAGDAIVPVYPPGLPLVMASFERLAGRAAVFWVVPFLSGLAVWATYLMGARMAGPVAGLAAACLMATSPTFLRQSLVAMSDVPATAWWALSLALLSWDRRDTVVAAGLAAGLAIITRPNLVPLALVAAAVVALKRPRDGSYLPALALRRLMLFGAGAAPAIVGLAIINARLYGSPFLTGYGSLRDLYALSHLLPNLQRYPAWMLQDTPIVPLAFAAPLAARGWWKRGSMNDPREAAICWLLFSLVVLLSYLFYLPFDNPGFLRFLVPAFPALFVLTTAACVGLLSPLGRAAPLLLMVIVCGVSLGRVHAAGGLQVFDAARSEQHVVAVGHYIANRLPERAVLISMQHSGSIRYYSGRVTLRYDWILRQRLPWLVAELRRLGYHPYIVLEEWEVPRFRTKFQAHTPLGALDWPPAAVHPASGSRIYDPADQQAAQEGRPIFTDVVR